MVISRNNKLLSHASVIETSILPYVKLYKCVCTEGLIGMAIVGGAAAVSVAGLGALIGFLVAKKS